MDDLKFDTAERIAFARLYQLVIDAVDDATSAANGDEQLSLEYLTADEITALQRIMGKLNSMVNKR